MSVHTRAPGRVNLIGEHTDYNGGLVMPCAIAYDTRILATARSDAIVNARSRFGEAQFDTRAVEQRRLYDWTDYVRGILFELQAAGARIFGADLVITETVPIGAGLSSSASFEIAVALAFLALSGAQIAPLELAQLARRAEMTYAGTDCGIMDQLAVLFGRKGCAIFIDTRTLEVEPLRFPEEAAIVICDTGTRRNLSDGRYNARREECDAAVAILKERAPHVGELRDVTRNELASARERLGPSLYRRVMHVVTENERVAAAKTALEECDLAAFGRLMNASHASLRDWYEVSSSALDTMVDLAQGFPGVYGARMTGGGFGGCAVALLDKAASDPFRDAIAQAYRDRTGTTPLFYDGTPSDGARVLDE